MEYKKYKKLNVRYLEIGNTKNPMCELSFDDQDYIWIDEEQTEKLMKKLQEVHIRLKRRREERRELRNAQNGGSLFR